MAADIQNIERQLAEFDARNSRQGLLVRYAHSRVSLFWWRQIMTVLGALGVAYLVSPLVGLLIAVVAVAGEGVDCLYLRSVPARLARGEPFLRIERISAVTAAIQALAISLAVITTWFGSRAYPTEAFAMIFLLGAAANAGVLLSFHRRATLARLTVYAVILPLVFLIELVMKTNRVDHLLFDAFAAAITAYICYTFIQSSLKNARTARRRSRELFIHSAELARANHELASQDKELRFLALVARYANDSVIISDADARIVWVNEGFTRITGYTAEEAIGQKPADLLNAPGTDLEVSDEIERAVAEGRPFRTQIMNRTKDGQLIWVGTNLVPIMNDQGQVDLMIAIERDITDIKAREAELARAKEAAEKSEAAKAQFLAAMSHEIRTPMNGIIGMADLLSEASLSRENRQFVETIRRSGEALLTIINDILDFSKLSAGKPVIHAVEFALRAPIDEAVMLLTPQVRKKGLFIDVVADSPLPDHVYGDDGRLRQILINIIGNAVKFTTEGGITVSLSNRADETCHHLSIAVHDTGIGIPEDRINHIFEEFAQADAATTRQFGGTGLGLSISRLLAREMGGDITATSTPGMGSRFVVTVTLGLIRDETLPPVRRVARPRGRSLDGLTVLVAEDNKTNQLLLSKYLKDQPVTLLFAETGKEAVEMVERHDPDIVLMDMEMPVMDGLTATRSIRKTRPTHPRIVALTANAYASDKATCLNAGMNAFLTKPLRKSDLLKTMTQVLSAAADPGRNRPPPPTATLPGA